MIASFLQRIGTSVIGLPVIRISWIGILLGLIVACSKSSTVDTDSGPRNDGAIIVDSNPGEDSSIVVDATSDTGSVNRSCSAPVDCIVVSQSCCGNCGQPSRDDAIAIHRDARSAHRDNVCDEGTGCPACAAPRDPTLIATCTAGQCEVVDLLEHSSGECSDSMDCRLRTIDCCECGGDISMEGIVAVSNEGDFAPLVCDPAGQGCPECAPIYPEEASAVCTSGQCTVSWQ